MKRCPDCGTVGEFTLLSGKPANRCAPCRQKKARQYEANANRQANKAERYGYQHRLQRESFAPLVADNTIKCGRCGELIHRGDDWDLDHLRNGTSWPAHSSCNRAAWSRDRRLEAFGTDESAPLTVGTKYTITVSGIPSG